MMATRFSLSLASLKDLHIVNFVYAYDTLDWATILLEINNTIYIGYLMEDSLLNTLYSEGNGINIDICPNEYYPAESISQTITIPDGTFIPILYDGVILYIPIMSPTPE